MFWQHRRGLEPRWVAHRYGKPNLASELREREMTWKVLGKKQLQPSLYNANIHTHMQKCSFPPAEIWHRQIKLVCPASASNKYAHMPRGVKREKWDFSCFHARLCTYTHAYELEDVKHTCVTTYMHIYTCERVSVCLSCQLQCPGHSHPSWVLAEQLAGGSSGREAAAGALHFPHSAFQHTWKCRLFWPRAGAGGHCFLVIVPLRGRKGQKREGASWNVEFYRTEMRGKSQAGIILRADGVGKMCKEDDINTRGLYESDEDNKNITMRKKNEANALLMVEITAAHPSLLPDEFIFKRTKWILWAKVDDWEAL